MGKMKVDDVLNGLYEAGLWITEVVSEGDFGKHHKFMCDAIDEASEIIGKLKKAYVKYNEACIENGFDEISFEEFLDWIDDLADEI